MKIFLFLPRKITGRFLVLLVACAGWMQSEGQQTKSPVQLADQYFAAGEYYTAAHLYEQFLNPSKKQKTVSDFPLNVKKRRITVSNKVESRTDILFKQAESYRLANYWQEAATSYKECIEKDSSQYAGAFYWQAVCERSLGHYSAAEESLVKYLSIAEPSSEFRENAKKELQTLQYILHQYARPDSILFKVQKLHADNSNQKGVFAPVHISNNQFLVSSTETDSVQVNGANPYHSRLFYTTLNNGSLDKMIPVMLPGTESLINQGAASMSADGNYLYFTQWKKENGNTVSSIYYATRQTNGWSSPTLLSSVNSKGFNSKQPFCSTDGKYLFFSSDRPGGSGKSDIWYAVLKNDGTTSEAVNAGTIINTSGDEQAPFYHNSSTTLVFSSNGRQGMGGYDLFESRGNEASWNLPENMGHPVNSARDDIYFFAPEKTPLLSNAIFSSDRGTGCCLETYTVSKAPKNKRIAGLVQDCEDNAFVSGAEVILKDISGKTWKATTDADGKYIFDMLKETYTDLTLIVNKELYKDTVASFKLENINETDLLTDMLSNATVCIEKIPPPPVVEKLIIKAENVVTVFFDFDKSILKPEAIEKLDSIYNVMAEYTASTIQISGYTDGRGTVEYNKVLSDKRARACADYLANKGIDTSRISFESFGACCPIEMELINGRDNAEGRSKNRRALINVKKD